MLIMSFKVFNDVIDKYLHHLYSYYYLLTLADFRLRVQKSAYASFPKMYSSSVFR